MRLHPAAVAAGVRLAAHGTLASTNTEALAAARQFIAGSPNPPGSCPSFTELCRLASDYGALAAVARQQNDPVHYLAGLLAARG